MSQVENYSFDAVACQLRFLTLPTFISILNVTGFTYLIHSIQSDKTLSIITDDFLTTMLLKSLVKKSWVSDPNRLSKKNSLIIRFRYYYRPIYYVPSTVT